MTNLWDILSDSIDIFKSEKDYGGTYMKKGVDLAIEMLQNIESENIQQTIFCLTDGVTNDYISKDYLEKIAEDGIKIYTIGLGQVLSSYLQYIADTTGGQYYYAKTSQELKDVFTDFEEEVSNDRNKDGLDDEITKLICKGEITTLLGNRVFCSKKNELSWEAMYDKIMENDDYDGDGLRNGDEIKIIFIDDKPYIDLICSPEYPDSDCDMISDSEELNIYLTNPLKSDYIVDSEDLMFINDCTNFEAGKAFDEYLNRPDYQIVAEYAFNVIICGGEINIIKMAKKEILDLFVSYADANVDSLELSSEINLVNSLLRGYIDLCVGLGLELDRIKINSQISQIQKEIMSLRGVDFSKLTKKALKSKIKVLNNLFEQHAEKANAIGKKGGYLGLALTAITSGLQTYEECGEYAAALEVSREYFEILNELKQCGNKNIETAAEQICEDMSGVQEKFMPYGSDYIKNMTVALGTAYSSYLLATTVPGLIADIIWLGADITLGNSFDAQITNFISVDCANGVSLATYKKLSGALYKKDKLGRVKLVLMENYRVLTIRRMYELDIYAREWAETKYLRYISNSGGLFKQNMIIFKTENSEKNAQNNILKLQKMYMDTVSRDIQ